LNVPVGLNFSLPEINYFHPVMDTLECMANEVERILSLMANALPEEI
jgi:hypothetical protein